MKKLPLALQLWSVREDQKKDFPGTVAAVREIGYEAAELYGYGNLEANKGIEVLLAADLKVLSMHVSIDRLRDDREAVAAEANALSCRNVVCPYLPPETFASADTCEGAGRELNDIGIAFREMGLDFYYHNHWWELDEIEGKIGFERLFAKASTENLSMELDVCFVKKMKLDPANYIRKHMDRIGLIHLKDGVPEKGETEFGEGEVDFTEVRKTASESPILRGFIMEQEHYHEDQLAVVRDGFEKLEALGF